MHSVHEIYWFRVRASLSNRSYGESMQFGYPWMLPPSRVASNQLPYLSSARF